MLILEMDRVFAPFKEMTSHHYILILDLKDRKMKSVFLYIKLDILHGYNCTKNML